MKTWECEDLLESLKKIKWDNVEVPNQDKRAKEWAEWEGEILPQGELVKEVKE